MFNMKLSWAESLGQQRPAVNGLGLQVQAARLVLNLASGQCIRRTHRTAGLDGAPDRSSGRREHSRLASLIVQKLNASSKTRKVGSLSQQGCQLNRRRQRRNWRVRAVERGPTL